MRGPLICVVVLFALAQVASAAPQSDAERLAAGLAKWREAKAACGGDYEYRVVQSSFTGFRAETVVVVRSNRVVERRYATTVVDESGRPGPLKNEWVETGEKIGTHPGAAPPRTVDQLYELARKIVEAETPEHHVRKLTLDKRGLLDACYVRDTRIQDDAPLEGVPPFQLTLEKK